MKNENKIEPIDKDVEWVSKWTDGYFSVCSEALTSDNIFNNIKRNNKYTDIVTQIPMDTAIKYFNNIDPSMLKYYPKLKQIDLLGNPELYEIEGYTISGNLCKWMYIASIIKKYLPDDIHTISEIGAGFGDLSFILHNIFNVTDYSLFDADEPLKLQTKVLNKFDIQPISCNINLNKNYGSDLVIACYSWSELGSDWKMKYLNKLIKECKYGYFMLNKTDENFDILKRAFQDREFVCLDIPNKRHHCSKIVIVK